MKAMKIVFAVTIVIMVAFGGMYLYICIPKMAGTEYTNADYYSILAKAEMQVELPTGEDNRISMADIINGDFTETGIKTLKNITVTAAEATAFFNQSIKPDLIENFNAAFYDGYMAVSFDIGNDADALLKAFPALEPYKKYVKFAAGKPLYWEFTAERVSDKSFAITTRALYLGRLKLSGDKINEGIGALSSGINEAVGNIRNFRVDALKCTEDGLIFSGTVPADVKRR